MEENNNPFIKKNIDEEIKDIISETPVSHLKKKEKEIEKTIPEIPLKQKEERIEEIIFEAPLKQKEKKIKNGRKKGKKNIICGAIIIVVIICGIYIIGSIPKECNCPTVNTNENLFTQQESINIFMSSIKQQIINKGYAEISDGTTTMKLSPYIG